ncbi:hypothetical protein P168DRAFT_326450 [Aspergillus campestris IBT 28561]|uniref:Spindle assembly checkpoint component MAD1 n=1 Tax=Aspergillus campestris (strain IBT 28561) TaxID=1392248 RepID=A0A2I1D426_ASPC2|nr:uncharacterized protein P168DRAFT_326450 [Aspergillus campestris IBT 28561]PKY04632.1 hypothetical protein P168DRAFT_326450 [Aspergillus campestris IBT 28561]
MKTRQTRQKRRHSSYTESNGDTGRTAGIQTPCRTPRRSSKRVRFSDPRPQVHDEPDMSTGLTPALYRTSFDESMGGGAGPRTPSRRRSTPLPRSRRWLDPLAPGDGSSPDRVVQFAPLRQILTPRTQRQIRRVGLSEEINHIEREKRDAAQYQKMVQTLRQERDSLKQELARAQTRDTPDSQSAGEDTTWMLPRAQIEHLQSENTRLREEISFSSARNYDQRATTPSETDTVLINDTAFEGTMLVSDSPDMRGIDGLQLPTPDDYSLRDQPSPNYTQDAELLALSLDLESAKKEKRDLFEACRSRLSALNGTPIARHLQQPSPPPEFLDSIVPTLTEALSRASDAASALDSVKEEVANLGFSGDSAHDMIAEMRDRFRSARLGLERAIPGETPGGLHDGNATLGALVKRVEVLVESLDDEQCLREGSIDRERALRGQFDDLLARYETASRKIRELEESTAASAGDMLHTRMRMQELEREGQEQTVGIDRLNEALQKYRDEVKGLESLVTELEEDKRVSNDMHKKEVARLEQRAVTAETTMAEREAHIQQLEDTVEQNRIRACDLTAKVEQLEKDHQSAMETLEQRTAQQLHSDQEIGRMNVRVSELTTQLEAAQAETAKLHRHNAGLEDQLRTETDARDHLLDQWAADQARSFAYMKETISNQRRSARARAANWEMKSDELQSSPTARSDPLTPISATRFVDVEVGRGKHRRRLDSGIGILTDEMTGSDDGAILPSDPADL